MGRKLGIPILHVPQLVALALGCSQADLRMKTHVVRPTGALAALSMSRTDTCPGA